MYPQSMSEAVLTCTHNLYFEQKYEYSKKNSTENCHFYSREILLYIAWTCFRNAVVKTEIRPHYENTPMQYTAIFLGCENDNFQLNFLTIFIFLLKTYIVGTR